MPLDPDPPAWASLVVDVPDFPKPGVRFLDITPLVGSAAGLREVVAALVRAVPRDVDVVVGMEARGFIFSVPVALALGVGFAPVRKPGKLPRPCVSVTYDLEYGTETLTLHEDAIAPGARVLIVDDVLATGGTVVATAELVRRLGGTVSQVAVVMELDVLHGRALLAEHGLNQVSALIHVGSEPAGEA
ncbi:adenine phosphoribosyltransferase [uncultured Friedmanniella sp.]|uniref:adenine phosphoribosyltransferase n=1 Tax=uncultured Friedmanniella sp. TaxID=335381 RepID=UPI0035CC8721